MPTPQSLGVCAAFSSIRLDQTGINWRQWLNFTVPSCIYIFFCCLMLTSIASVACKPKQLILPRVRTSGYVKSFFFRSALLWNTLPANLQNITCHRKFKKNIEAHWSAHKYSTKFCLLPWSLSWWTLPDAKLNTPSTTCNSFLCVLLFAVHVFFFFFSSSYSLLLLWTKTIMTNNGWKTDNNKETEVRTRYKNRNQNWNNW